MTHAINDPKGALVGIMLVARNVEYLSQVQSTVRYSRKLAALGRLSAGVAHEVKNPLNAMMIHLELLRQQVGTAAAIGVRGGAAGVGRRGAGRSRRGDAARRRHRQRNPPARRGDAGVPELRAAGGSEAAAGAAASAARRSHRDRPSRGRSRARRTGQRVHRRGRTSTATRPCCDRRFSTWRSTPVRRCRAAARCGSSASRSVSRAAVDAACRSRSPTPAVGIQPDHLKRIFDLYFTTKEKGSGIGLSMVYRTVQMHDGEIEVQSTPGSGTTFRVLLPQA